MDQDHQGASSAAETICVCRDGHNGDPDDLSRGCAVNAATSGGQDEKPGDGEAPQSSSSSSLLAVDEIEKNPPAAPQPPPTATTTSGAEKCR